MYSLALSGFRSEEERRQGEGKDLFGSCDTIEDDFLKFWPLLIHMGHKYKNSPIWNSSWGYALHGIGLGQSARSQESRGGSPLPKIGHGLCQ